jgi:uncharacterized protein (UPF0335 family)
MTDTTHENHIVQATSATLTLDVAQYEQYLEHWALSEQEKQDLLQTLWNLMCEFVFLGFGVSPVQHVIQDFQGQVKENSATNFATGLDLDQVESSCTEKRMLNEKGGFNA